MLSRPQPQLLLLNPTPASLDSVLVLSLAADQWCYHNCPAAGDAGRSQAEVTVWGMKYKANPTAWLPEQLAPRWHRVQDDVQIMAAMAATAVNGSSASRHAYMVLQVHKYQVCNRARAIGQGASQGAQSLLAAAGCSCRQGRVPL